MFVELKNLVGKSPLAMMVALEGDDLRVNITQKETAKGHRPLSISIVATAEDLDRDLPAEIVRAAGELARPAPIAEQVASQVAATPEPVAKKKPAKKAKPAKKPKPAPKPAPKPKAAKPAKSAKVALPRSTPAKKPAAPAGGVKHHASRPGKEEVIAEYLKLCENEGDTLSREDFIKLAPSGRRFERLWGMSWHKFKAAAEAARGKTNPATPERDTRTMPLEQQADDLHTTMPIRPVKNSDGVELCMLQRVVVVGESITIGRNQWIVRAFDKACILVQPKQQEEVTA